jgi:subtilisin family serine protease
LFQIPRRISLGLPFGSSRSSVPMTRYRWLIAICVALLLVGVVIGLALTPRGHAQGNSTHRDSAFAKKADKLLQLVRRANAHDLAVPAPSGKSHLESLSRRIGVQRNAGGRVTADVVVKLKADSEAELKNAGFAIGARIGDMATLRIDLAQLENLAALVSVEKISAAVRRYPTNDRARLSAAVENELGQRLVTQTGQGVVVAIIDTGIDFRHADFTVPGSGGHQTRIKALLDMTEYGSQSPDPGWNYILPGQSAPIGHLYTEADINAALQVPKPPNQNNDLLKQRDKNGHGTHVAGTAAGNGQSSPTAGTYSGIAPEADLIVVKASRENDGSASFLTSDIINALQFVQQKATELNKPFVANLSLGGQLGPHDGTLPDERAIDNLVNSGLGRVVTVAAGNEGQSSTHARAIVPAGGSITLDYNVNGFAEIVDLYAAHADRFTVTITSPDGVILGPVVYDPNGFSLPNGQASNQYLYLYNANDDKGDSDPNNDQPDIVAVFNPAAPDGLWKITIQDADANSNQSFDAWTEGFGVYFSTNVDNDSHLVGSPGTARGAITVGATVVRSISETIGSTASFTSPGPTADERQKPEISAPGHYLYSARSTDIVDPNFGIIGSQDDAPTDATHYVGLSGTSMATPVTSGAIALLLQSNPTLSADQVKSRLTNFSVKDIFTGSEPWHRRAGFGKLNIFNSITQTGGGLRRFSISGRVTNQDGSAVSNLFIVMTGYESAVVATDANGNYLIPNVSAGGSYTVQPNYEPPPISYTPPYQRFNSLNSDKTLDFVRILAPNPTIGGRLTDQAGNGLAGILVQALGVQRAPVTTDGNGNYVIDVPYGSTVSIEPASNQYTFTPPSTTLFNVIVNQSANFVGQPGAQPPKIEFVGPFVTTSENNSAALVQLKRSGDTSGVANVTYGTIYHLGLTDCSVKNGIAYSRCDYSTTNGTLTFAANELSKWISIPLVNDSYAENTETFGIALSSVTGAEFGNLTTLLIRIDDNETSDGPNPLAQNGFFVRQHYIDFLGREPDPAGFAGWQSLLNNCPTGDITCDRIHVSQNFYQSPEFQQRGYFIYRFYPLSFGRKPDYLEFVPDLARVSGFLSDAQLEAAKQSFIAEFMTRPAFVAKFNALSNTQYVDTLLSTAGVTNPARDFWIGALNDGSRTRAQVLREIAESTEVYNRYYNQAFVVMQYFGYLRRDPDAAYLDWIQVLNTTGDSRGMIIGFVNSLEYRYRFGP